MNKPTRFYSNLQERKVAKAIGGKQTANSGATAFYKGDVSTDQWLIECKTCEKVKASFTLKQEWFDKNLEEAFAMNKDYNALCFDFGPNTKRYYVIDERMFKRLVESLKE